MAAHTDISGADDPLDPVTASVAAYSDHAEDYEAAHAVKMLDRVEQFAHSLPAPSLILDAGCGPGRDLARFTARGHVVRGADLNPAFVAMANAHAPTSLCDLRDLGSRFSDGTFDGIWACASLVHLPDSEAADVLGQFARLLRPGGKLYACVKAIGETGWIEEPDGRRWYTAWGGETFVAAVAEAGFAIEQVVQDVFIEVWGARVNTIPACVTEKETEQVER